MPSATKKRPGRPKDASHCEQRRDDILTAAAKIFAKHGYRNTEVEYIAQALKVAKGTIYRYFPSKEELFFATADRGMNRAAEFVDASINGLTDPLERMSRAVRAYLTFFRDHPEYVELFIQERAEFRDRPQQTYFAYRDRRAVPWREAFRVLIKEGRIRKFPPERIVGFIGNVIYGTMFTNYLTGRKDSPEHQANEIMDIVLRGLLTNAAPGKATAVLTK
ncbi:MAG TPA: TetR/AcrR family transcriptional regulator [Lacipirellulaceae bacterium]|nr:TetR/AcrR family transcriptional regulator [Lacipirellulaceae bacterium]